MADFLDGGYRALRRLRDTGEVGAIGVGVNEVAVCLELLDRVELDVILLAGRYTLLEQADALPLIDRCRASNTRLVIGGPYNSGILVEGSRGASHFNYAPPPPAIVARVAELERICAAFDVPLAAAALQFPTREPVVAGVIPGLVGKDQVAATLRYAEWPIPPALWDAIRSAGSTS
jgi:D-threo-aldose 1-dehydrogenase